MALIATPQEVFKSLCDGHLSSWIEYMTEYWLKKKMEEYCLRDNKKYKDIKTAYAEYPQVNFEIMDAIKLSDDEMRRMLYELEEENYICLECYLEKKGFWMEDDLERENGIYEAYNNAACVNVLMEGLILAYWDTML